MTATITFLRANALRALLAALPMLFVFAATEARAELTICNETGDLRYVAIGYQATDDWFSEGWWVLEQSECKTVVGGDLNQQNYYYRAKDASGQFDGEGYMFCTDSDIFEISGDSKCEARGYVTSSFSLIDTGPTALSFTYTLSGGGTKVTKKAPPPTDPSGPDTSPAGTYGEPITITGQSDGCDRVDGLLTCYVIADDGWTYVAYDDGRTPLHLLDTLDSLAIGTIVTISGDLWSQGDISVDVILRSVDVSGGSGDSASTGGSDGILDGLTGYWMSLDDSASAVSFTPDGRMIDIYDGNLIAESDIFIRDSCLDDAPTDTLHLVAIDVDTSDIYCYILAELNADYLTLIYTPRGNELRYVRDD